MDPAAVVRLLCMVVQGNGASFKTIDESQLPLAAGKALASWAASNNVPIRDTDTTGAFYQITLDGDSSFLVDFSGDDPDQFRSIAVLQDDRVIGESLQVAGD
jgi:hypothetical protein